MPTKKAAPAAKKPATKASAKKASAKKSAATKTSAATKKSTDTKAPATKASAKKAGSATKKVASATKAPAATKKAPAAKKAPATKKSPATKKAPATKAPAPSLHGELAGGTAEAPWSAAAVKIPSAARVAKLPVRPGEDPWTTAELTAVRDELLEEVQRLQEQISVSTAELEGLVRDGSDGAGRDPADVGTSNFERDHEISLANNARDMLTQTVSALRHIQNGSYGRCDSCGEPIGKGRLQVFPRATLCVSCKQREERR